MNAWSAPLDSQSPATDPPVDEGPRLPPRVRLAGLTKRFSARRTLGEIVRLRARRPPVTVVDHVDLEVAAGEIFGLLGPNGAGKTTIFKILSTLIIPDDGSARVSGFDVVHGPQDVRRTLGTVPADERSLNWRLTARENLRLYAALHQLPRGSVEPRINEVLAVVGLADTNRKMVAEFSTGMRQRLLIARALLPRPAVLLLDEPTRGLDPLSAESLRAFIREELVERRRCTVLIATHDTGEAFGLCDRVGVLHRGRLLATGPAGELAGRIGLERVRIVTQDVDHPAWELLERRGLFHRLSAGRPGADGWGEVEASVPGGPSRSARVLSALVDYQVRVARFERVETTLAALIARIIATREAAVDA